MSRENMIKQPGYTSKIIDLKMHKDFDKKENRVTNVLFDITYEETRPDGSVYQYVLKGVDSPFREICNISHDVSASLFVTDYWHVDPLQHVQQKLELKDGETVIRGNYIVKCVKDPDPIDVTMDEIESKFGRKIRIVKEK